MNFGAAKAIEISAEDLTRFAAGVKKKSPNDY